MKLFGISARSLTGFQNAMYLVTALTTIVLLRRHKAPVWLEFLVPLGVAAAFLPFGLRPEPLPVALTMTGFAMIECGCCRSDPVFIAFLLMFLGGATAPRLTLFQAHWFCWRDFACGKTQPCRAGNAGRFASAVWVRC